ncbi:MAG: tetratricopeptide repeat protein, partial [Betaproteobacteria bacterium]
MKNEKLLQSAIDAHLSGDLTTSESLYRKFLRSNPVNHDANNNLGLILFSSGRFEEAAAIFQRLVSMFPQDKFALINLGNCHAKQKRYETALACYHASIKAYPEFETGWYNYAKCLGDLERYEESLSAYDRVLELNTTNDAALGNRAISLHKLQRYEEALQSVEASLALNPTRVESLVSYSQILRALGQHERARACIEQAIKQQPEMAEAWAAYADVLQQSHHSLDAVNAYQHAISLAPNSLDILENFGELLLALKNPDAVRIYQRLLSLAPKRKFALGQLIHAQTRIFDWSSLDEGAAGRIRDGVNNQEELISPLIMLSLSDSSEDQLNASRTFTDYFDFPSECQLRATNSDGRKLRIAYLSGDLCNHPVSILMRGVFEKHDKNSFETFAVSFRSFPDDPYQTRLKSLFDHWLDVEHESDVQVVERLRALNIDIAIDLMGHTTDPRLGILARRVAPVQVNYLGYPGTMGAGFIDYIIADRYVIPQSESSNYSEKVVYLPDCFQANDSMRGLPQKDRVTRQELGLSEDCFV